MIDDIWSHLRLALQRPNIEVLLYRDRVRVTCRSGAGHHYDLPRRDVEMDPARLVGLMVRSVEGAAERERLSLPGGLD